MEGENIKRGRLQRILRLGRAVRFVWDSGPGWLIASLAFVLVQGLLPLLSLYLLKLVIDAVTGALTSSPGSAEMPRIFLLVGLAALVAVVTVLVRQAARLVGEAQGLAVTDHMQDLIHAKSIAVDLDYYENPGYFDTLHRAQEEAPHRPARLVQNLAEVARSGVTLAAMAGLLLTFHWSVALLLFLAVLPGVLVRIRNSRILFHWLREQTPVEREAAYYDWLVTRPEHAKELRLFGLGELFARRFNRLRSGLRAHRIQLARRRSLAEGATETGAVLAVFAALAFLAYRTVRGAVTIGGMVMYFQAFQRGVTSLREFLGGLAELYEHSLFLANLYEFLDIQPGITAPSDPAPPPDRIKQGVRVEGLRFTYPGGEPVLDGVTMELRAGTVTALVGVNGAGKTTLVKLLCRLYDPDAGTITVDGTDLRRFDPAALRSRISVIFQDFARYHFSVAENIAFGDIAAEADVERIAAAARRAGAEPLVEKLPHRYDTRLGKWFEDGVELSAGEWQLIALTRGFFRRAELVILDEPSAALDAKTEAELFRRFKDVIGGRTALIISHRFSTVRGADMIYVLAQGRIVESGGHEELMRQGGLYSELFNAQASLYR